jgi:hypothetical protein
VKGFCVRIADIKGICQISGQSFKGAPILATIRKSLKKNIQLRKGKYPLIHEKRRRGVERRRGLLRKFLVVVTLKFHNFLAVIFGPHLHSLSNIKYSIIFICLIKLGSKKRRNIVKCEYKLWASQRGE